MPFAGKSFGHDHATATSSNPKRTEARRAVRACLRVPIRADARMQVRPQAVECRPQHLLAGQLAAQPAEETQAWLEAGGAAAGR